MVSSEGDLPLEELLHGIGDSETVAWVLTTLVCLLMPYLPLKLGLATREALI